MLSVRLACAMLLSATVCGCAASTYQKQVSGLSDGFTKTTASFEGLIEDERQAFVRSQTRLGLNDNSQLQVPSSCKPQDIDDNKKKRNPKPIDCRVRIAKTDPKTHKVTYRTIVFDPAAPKGLELAKKLDAYGKGLVTLASAKDVADLKDGIDKTNSAIGALRKALLPKAPAEPFTAETNFGVWVVGKLLDAIRVQQLKNAVSDADPYVKNAADLLAHQARLAQQSIIVQRAEILEHDSLQIAHLRKGLAKNPDGGDAAVVKAADDFVAGSLAMQNFARLDVTKPFMAMREAHAKLLKALYNPDLPSDQVFSQISEFIDQVGKLNAAIVAARKDK